ncbi:GFA family protein [Thaumasiovibrio subtropicus]|uniref:GFA family protein n=1 Tax=Thaumasiovibrio subtropicus TaxID=1891207 RepID=UPI000B34B615|nr:GFA family protein [Thaumasiovibrio subtropicus]
MYRGSCLCGEVRLVISGEIERAMHCHCSMCQKAHGSAFASYGLVRREAFQLTGHDSVASYLSSPGVTRTFCRRCGANLMWADESEFNRDWVSFSLALLDDECQPQQHTEHFTESAPHWSPCQKRR